MSVDIGRAAGGAEVCEGVGVGRAGGAFFACRAHEVRGIAMRRAREARTKMPKQVRGSHHGATAHAARHEGMSRQANP